MGKLSQDELADINQRILILNTLDDYLLEMMKISEISSVSYYRVTSAIKHMRTSYEIIKRFPSIKPDLSISLQELNKIIETAKPIEVDETNISVKDFIDFYEKLVGKYLDSVMQREVQQVIDTDVEKLLSAINKANEKIDE